MNKNFKRTIFAITFFFFYGFAFSKEYSEETAKNLRNAICAKVKTFIGCPYRSGAIGPDSFDCSGLVFTVYNEAANIQLPRSVKAIYAAATIVPRNELEEGDLVFFKTTGDGSISHTGIYIGRNQFIHAASDGSNTGVIVSSLNEKYYKNCYAAVGKIITSKKKQNSQQSTKVNQNTTRNLSQEKLSSSLSESPSSSSVSNYQFASNIAIDSFFYCDWNLWLYTNFQPNFRGISYLAFARYLPWKIQPALGTGFKWNQGIQVFQIPLLVNVKFNDFFSCYIGPVMNFGHAKIAGTENYMDNSFWASTVGFCVSTPEIPIGAIAISFVQDINYTFYTTKSGKVLSLGESVNNGLVFSTGVRVTLPLKNVLK